MYFYNAGCFMLSSIKYSFYTFYLNFSNLKIIDLFRMAAPENLP